jgi:hypothetical protein
MNMNRFPLIPAFSQGAGEHDSAMGKYTNVPDH